MVEKYYSFQSVSPLFNHKKKQGKKKALKILFFKALFEYPGPGSNRHECYLIGF